MGPFPGDQGCDKLPPPGHSPGEDAEIGKNAAKGRPYDTREGVRPLPSLHFDECALGLSVPAHPEFARHTIGNARDTRLAKPAIFQPVSPSGAARRRKRPHRAQYRGSNRLGTRPLPGEEVHATHRFSTERYSPPRTTDRPQQPTALPVQKRTGVRRIYGRTGRKRQAPRPTAKTGQVPLSPA